MAATSFELRRDAGGDYVRVLSASPTYAAFFAASAATYGGNLVGMLSDRVAFFFLSALLTAYIAWESWRARKVDRGGFLLMPPVLSSFFMFGLLIAFTNVIYFLPPEVTMGAGVGFIDEWAVKYMWLAILAALALWLGFWSPIGSRMAGYLGRSPLLSRLQKRDPALSAWAVLSLAGLSIGARLVAIRLGAYGYSLNEDVASQLVQYREYFNLAEAAGKLTLFALALQYFSRNTAISLAALLIMLTLEILFGFASGFKAAVVLPVIIVGMGKYAVTGRLPLLGIVTAVVLIFLAYMVIEPFRAVVGAGEGGATDSLERILQLLFGETLADSRAQFSGADTAMAIMSRLNATYIGSLGLEYEASVDVLPEGSPSFLMDIFMAPINAYVPRLVWEAKTLNTLGNWYYTTVLGLIGPTSVAMSPITYLNFAGGTAAVVIGFAAVGVVQRLMNDWLRRPGRAGGLLIYIGIIGTVAIVDSAYNTFYVALLRFIPLLFVAQYCLFRR